MVAPWVIAIVGPTAVGKTDVAIQLARALNTSILSADSRQCYREMTIGTAKPSPQQQAQVSHGFIDTHSIHHPVTGADFETEGLTFLNKVFKSNKTAIVAGGSGLYLKALLEGLDRVPVPALNVRTELQERLKQKGLSNLENELYQKDPEACKFIDTKNPSRVLRALEVKTFTGYSILDYWQKTQHSRPFNILKIGLSLSRDLLHSKIHKRCKVMLEEGLLDEVEALYPFRSNQVLQTVGYQEFFDHLSSNCSYSEAVEKFEAHTRQFAKRQLTWFRRDPNIHWFHPESIVQIASFIHQKTGYLSTFDRP